MASRDGQQYKWNYGYASSWTDTTINQHSMQSSESCPKPVRRPYIHIESNHAVCGKFTNNVFVNSSSNISLILVINVPKLAGWPFLKKCTTLQHVKSSEHLKYSAFTFVNIWTKLFYVEQRARNTSGTMGMPAVGPTQQLTNPASREAYIML
jgi:hypothetical protein